MLTENNPASYCLIYSIACSVSFLLCTLIKHSLNACKYPVWLLIHLGVILLFIMFKTRKEKQKGAVCCQEGLSWICWMFTTPDTVVWDCWVGISRYLFCSWVQFNSQTLRSSSKSAFMAEHLLTLQTDGRQGEKNRRRRRGAQISVRGCKRDFRQDAFSPTFQEGRCAFLMQLCFYCMA